MGMNVECSFFGAILTFIQSSNIKYAQIIKQSVIYQAVLDTVRKASWGKIKNCSFASDLRSVHISRYALKIPGEIV